MTAIIGFQSTNGVVLCADSEESDGYTKRIVPKVWCYSVGEDWGIAIATAGDADLADSYTSNLFEILGNSDFDEAKLMAKLRTSIAQIRYDYPNDELAMLVAIYSNTFPLESRLYRVQGKHLGPVKRYQSLGIGSAVTDLICSQIHSPLFNIEESARLGIFAIARAKELVQGCGGPTRVISYRTAQYHWITKSEGEISTIENEFNEESFRKHLQDYWVSKNPIASFPGGYKWMPPAPLRWRKTAKLNTES